MGCFRLPKPDLLKLILINNLTTKPQFVVNKISHMLLPERCTKTTVTVHSVVYCGTRLTPHLKSRAS